MGVRKVFGWIPGPVGLERGIVWSREAQPDGVEASCIGLRLETFISGTLNSPCSRPLSLHGPEGRVCTLSALRDLAVWWEKQIQRNVDTELQCELGDHSDKGSETQAGVWDGSGLCLCALWHLNLSGIPPCIVGNIVALSYAYSKHC